MSFLHSPVRRVFASTTISATRRLSTTARLALDAGKTPPPPPNHPPTAQKVGRKTYVSEDKQSSASTKGHGQSDSGDDHPAKQPDPQQASSRSTGFKEGTAEVKGGKEGIERGERSDK